MIFPLAGAFPHHSLAIVAHWPRQRRLSVISAYLPADDDPLSQRLCSSLGEWAATSGEDFFILAAWNREPKLLPLGYLLAAGTFSALVPDPFFCDLGTHRLENGVYTGRTIDFGISSSGIGTTSPLQRLGPADHDLVAYDIPLKGTRRGWRWQPRRLLDGETTSNWNKLWADVENEFTALLDVGNTEARRIQLFQAGEAGEHEVFGVRLPPTAKGAVNKQGKRRRAPTKITYGKCKRVVQTPKEIAEHPCKFVVGGRRVSSQQRLQDKTAGGDLGDDVLDGIQRALAIFEADDDQPRQEHQLRALAWPVTPSDFTVKHVCSACGGGGDQGAIP